MYRALLVILLGFALFGCGAAPLIETQSEPNNIKRAEAIFFSQPPPWPDAKALNMQSQTAGALADLRNQLVSKGLSLQDCTSIKAFVRAQQGQSADFDGFFFAYSRVFGTRLNPNQPHLVQIQVSRFADPQQLVLLEASCG